MPKDGYSPPPPFPTPPEPSPPPPPSPSPPAAGRRLSDAELAERDAHNAHWSRAWSAAKARGALSPVDEAMDEAREFLEHLDDEAPASRRLSELEDATASDAELSEAQEFLEKDDDETIIADTPGWEPG